MGEMKETVGTGGGTSSAAPAVGSDPRPWTWEEDGYTVIRGNARTAPGCHNNCGVLMYVKDGKLEKVEGDPENPYNQGRLCSRCLAMTDVVYHEDRLMHPMKRAREDRGKEAFEQISWDEAYEIIEREFKRISDEYGPWSIIFGQGTGRDIQQMSRLAFSMGCPNEGVPYFSGNSCYLPRISSMAILLGNASVADCSQFLPKRYDDPEYVVPELIIIWGCNPLWANPDGFFGHWITDLMKRGSKIAVIDPQLTWLAARAGKNWLRVRPGGDGALAMAMLKTILDEDLYDHDFCDKWVYGLDEVKQRCAEYDYDELAERSWVPLDQIKRLAREYAAAKPAAIHWGVALDQQTGGQQAAHTITSLWTITGNLDVPGGNVIGQSCWGIEASNWTAGWGYHELLTEEQKDHRLGVHEYPMYSAGFLNPAPGTCMKALDHGDPYEVHAVYLATSNFLACMGNRTQKQLEWYKKLDFIVVADLFMTPTMMALADVVLPVCTWAERMGFGGMQPYYLGCINPAIDPLGETKSDNQMFLELGKRIQQTEAGWPWDDLEEMNDDILKDGGFTWKDLRDSSWKYPKFEYRKYEKGLLRPDGQVGFNTPTGRAELYSTIFHQVGCGLDPLPSYVEPTMSPYSMPEEAKEYPLVLTTGARVPGFFHSEHRQIKKLRRLHPDPLVYIHPQTAAAYGIEEGEWIWIENMHGKCKYKTSFNATYDPRVLQAEHAWWFPERKGEEEDGLFGVFESNCNNLVPFDTGVSGFGANYKCMICKIYKDED